MRINWCEFFKRWLELLVIIVLVAALLGIVAVIPIVLVTTGRILPGISWALLVSTGIFAFIKCCLDL